MLIISIRTRKNVFIFFIYYFALRYKPLFKHFAMNISNIFCNKDKQKDLTFHTNFLLKMMFKVETSNLFAYLYCKIYCFAVQKSK